MYVKSVILSQSKYNTKSMIYPVAVKDLQLNTFARFFSSSLSSLNSCMWCPSSKWLSHIKTDFKANDFFFFFLLWCSFSMIFTTFPFSCLFMEINVWFQCCQLVHIASILLRSQISSESYIPKRIYKCFAFATDLWITEHFS